MDWRFRRYFAVRTRYWFHNRDIQGMKNVPGVKVWPPKYPNRKWSAIAFNEVFPDEQESRGYHNVVVSCRKENFEELFDNWLFKMEHVIEILPRKKEKDEDNQM